MTTPRPRKRKTMRERMLEARQRDMPRGNVAENLAFTLGWFAALRSAKRRRKT